MLLRTDPLDCLLVLYAPPSHRTRFPPSGKCETDSRFKVSPDELQSRKEFVSSTKGKIRMIRDTVNSSRTSTKEQNDQREVLMKKPKASGQTDRYQRMEDDNNRDNESFIENTQQRNQQQVNRQDQELDVLSNSVMRIKAVGEEINIELAEQNKMLDDLDEDVDKADTGIRKNMKKLGKLMAEKDRGKICTIFLLLIILIALSYFTFSS